MVHCPRCKKEFSYYSSEFRPFCCQRCKLVDLGNWLNESYQIPDKKSFEQEMLEKENNENYENNVKENNDDEHDENEY